MLVQKAKEVGHKRWDHRIKNHRRVCRYRHTLLRLLPAMLVQTATEAGHDSRGHRLKTHKRVSNYRHTFFEERGNRVESIEWEIIEKWAQSSNVQILFGHYFFYLVKLEKQAKDARHKRWEHKIKVYKRVSSRRHTLYSLLPAMLVQEATEAGHKSWGHRIKTHKRVRNYRHTYFVERGNKGVSIEWDIK